MSAYALHPVQTARHEAPVLRPAQEAEPQSTPSHPQRTSHGHTFAHGHSAAPEASSERNHCHVIGAGDVAPAYDAHDYCSWDRAIAKAKLARPAFRGPFFRASGLIEYEVVGSTGNIYTVERNPAGDLSCSCEAGAHGRSCFHAAWVHLQLPRCGNCATEVVWNPGDWCAGCASLEVACRAQVQESTASLMASAPSYWLPTAIAAVRAGLR